MKTNQPQALLIQKKGRREVLVVIQAEAEREARLTEKRINKNKKPSRCQVKFLSGNGNTLRALKMRIYKCARGRNFQLPRG